MVQLPHITQHNPRVAVIGSINVDYMVYVDSFPLPGQTILSQGFSKSNGGKGANAAVAAAQAGAETIFIAALGNDAQGEQFLAELRRYGVHTEYIYRSDVVTGSAFITVDSQGDNYIVVAGGANEDLSGDYVRDCLTAAHQLEPFVALLISSEISSNCVEAALKFGLENNLWTVFNPAPVVSQTIEVLRQYTHDRCVVTPNKGEAEAIAKQLGIAAGEDLISLLQGLSHELGIIVVATDGERGAITVEPQKTVDTVQDQIHRVPSLQVATVDTVGAGDTFNGYCVVGLAENVSVQEATRAATRAAALSTTYYGAWPPEPTCSQ